jgi:hypothetical protein
MGASPGPVEYGLDRRRRSAAREHQSTSGNVQALMLPHRRMGGDLPSSLLVHLAQTDSMERDSRDQPNQSKQLSNACTIDLLDYLRTTP